MYIHKANGPISKRIMLVFVSVVLSLAINIFVMWYVRTCNYLLLYRIINVTVTHYRLYFLVMVNKELHSSRH